MRGIAAIAFVFLLCALCRGAEPPKLTDSQKLAIREAQVEVLSIQAQIQQLTDAAKKAEAKLMAAVDAAKKACGGEVKMDLSCEVKPPAAPEKK